MSAIATLQTAHLLNSQLAQANQIGKEYEARGGDYKNEPGSKNKPKRGPPEEKSEATKSEETEAENPNGNDFKSDDSGKAPDYYVRNGIEWTGSKHDPDATETDSQLSEIEMTDEDDPWKQDKKTNGDKKQAGRPKKGTAKHAKKNIGNDKDKENKDAKEKKGSKQKKSPRMGERRSERQAQAASASASVGEKRKSAGVDSKEYTKKAKK